MIRWQRNLLFVIALLIALIGAAWLLMPRVVDVLPGQIRGRLPDEFLELVTTPLPTALPLPLQIPGATDPDSLVWSTANLTRTATPSPSLTPSRDEASTIEPRDGPVVTSTPTEARPSLSPSPTMTPSPTATALPRAVKLDGLQVTAQKYNNCGPANLSIVLNYYGHQVNQLEIGEALKPNYDDRNVSPSELVAYVANETDLRADIFHGLEIAALQRLLAAGFPVIIEKGLQLTATHGWMGHYLTLYGYDELHEVFYGLDTFLGPWDSAGREFDFASLEELWAQFNRAAVVVYPPERASEMVMAVGPDGHDEQAMWLAAAERARAALRIDSGDAFAWFDLGASLYHLAEIGVDSAYYDQSASAFDRAREIGLPWRTLWYQFEPYLAYLAAGRLDEVLALTDAVLTTSGGRNIEETYLYRGHALLAGGDRAAAERAYERALRLNPGMELAQEALQALSNGSATGDAKDLE